MKLIVTIPAYNEEKTITSVIKEVPRRMEGIDIIEVVLVDDGSTDNTTAEATKAGVNAIVTLRTNKGLGVAFRKGLDFALEKGADIIVNIDADRQYNATQIPALVKPILDRKADIVLGWRDIDNLDFMPRGKKLGNKLATWLTGRLSGLPIKDAQTGFRAFSREAALRMNLGGKYTYVQETLIQAAHKDIPIAQVPIEFRHRDGKSRLIPSLGTYATRAAAIIFGTYRDYHPLKFFSSIGGFFLLIGLGFGVRVMVHFSQTGMVSPHLPSATLASLLITIGLGTIALGIFTQMLNSQGRLNEEILYRLKKNARSKEEQEDSKSDPFHNPQVSTSKGRDGKSSL